MKKNTSTLPIKGLRTPRLLLWLRGFFHGRILHTGELDPETEMIASGYVTGQLRRYDKACIQRCEQAAERLKDVWADLDQLLIELDDVSTELRELVVPQRAVGETGAQARAREKKVKRRAALEERQLTILKRMSDHANAILAEATRTRNQMAATAEALLSGFAAYGHGLILRPVLERNLPTLAPDDRAAAMFANHAATWNTVQSILKEVQDHASL